MANQILIKRSATPAKAPVIADLVLGELGMNSYDGKLFLKKNNGSDSIVEIGAHTFAGDVTGAGNGAIAMTLAASGVTAGTYTKLTVDAKGRATVGTTMNNADIVGSLGYTPYNATNPSAYISGNQTIAVSGDATASGTTSLVLTLAASGVTAGTYRTVTVDAKGRVTGGTNPTTLAGHGITDAAPLASPALTGVPTAPTAATGASTTQLATTAFAVASIAAAAPTYTGTNASGTWNISVSGNAATVSGITSAQVVAALGYTPSNSGGAGKANGYATLDTGGKIVTSQLPAIAITDTFVVASQAAMLLLTTAGTGDVAVRTDVNKSFILKGTTYSTLSDWQELLTPTDTILSVNGQTGSVTLSTSNIAEGSNLYYTNARASAAAPVQTVFGRNGAVVLAASDVNAAYGYTPLSGNQNIVVSGDATGSGATAITLTLAASGVTAGTYRTVTVDAKGRVTGGTNPTTLAGHGITDAMQVGVTIDGGSF